MLMLLCICLMCKQLFANSFTTSTWGDDMSVFLLTDYVQYPPKYTNKINKYKITFNWIHPANPNLASLASMQSFFFCLMPSSWIRFIPLWIHTSGRYYHHKHMNTCTKERTYDVLNVFHQPAALHMCEKLYFGFFSCPAIITSLPAK